MLENKSPFGDCHEMAHIWAKIQEFYQIFRIRTV